MCALQSEAPVSIKPGFDQASTAESTELHALEPDLDPPSGSQTIRRSLSFELISDDEEAVMLGGNYK